MVKQKIMIDCNNINEKGFGMLLNNINRTLEDTEMDMYVKTEILNGDNKK